MLNIDQNDSDDNFEDGITITQKVVTLLRILASIRSIDDIPTHTFNYLKSFSDVMSFEDRSAVSKQMIELHGLSILLFTLQKCQTENQEQNRLSCIYPMMDMLVEITREDGNSGRVIVNLGGVDTILAVAKIYPGNVIISADVMKVLLHLNINEGTTDAVIGEECVDYCIKVITDFPTKLEVLSVEAEFLSEMSKVEDRKNVLFDKRVHTIISKLFTTFRGKRKYKHEQQILEESMARLFKPK